MAYNVDYTPMQALADLSLRAGQGRANQQTFEDQMQGANYQEEVQSHMASEKIAAMQARGALARIYDTQQYHQGSLAQRQYATDTRGDIADENDQTRMNIAGQNNDTKTNIAGVVDATKQRGQDINQGVAGDKLDLGYSRLGYKYDELDQHSDEFDKTHALKAQQVADQLSQSGDKNARTKLAIVVQQQAAEKAPIEQQMKQISAQLKDPMLNSASRAQLQAKADDLYSQLGMMTKAHVAQLDQVAQQADGGQKSQAPNAQSSGVTLNNGAVQGQPLDPKVMQQFVAKHKGDQAGAAVELASAGYNVPIPKGVKVATQDDYRNAVQQAGGDPQKALGLLKAQGFNYNSRGEQVQ